MKEEKCHFSHGFPSVTKAPINISKLKSTVNFQNTNIDEAFIETIDFYNKYKILHVLNST